MKQYRFDYRNQYGLTSRWWIEAENQEDAEQKAMKQSKWFRGTLIEGSVKELKYETATKDNTDVLFEQHAMSFVSGLAEETIENN